MSVRPARPDIERSGIGQRSSRSPQPPPDERDNYSVLHRLTAAHTRNTLENIMKVQSKPLVNKAVTTQQAAQVEQVAQTAQNQATQATPKAGADAFGNIGQALAKADLSNLANRAPGKRSAAIPRCRSSYPPNRWMPRRSKVASSAPSPTWIGMQ